MYDAAGRFKGYARGIPGHQRRKANTRLHAFRQAMLAKARELRQQPLGATRLHDSGRGVYRRIKVARSGKWPYEHRIVVERTLGRKLGPREHVHHINGDTLDNRPENLQVLSPEAHRSHHSSITTWSRQYEACVKCGETARKHLARGLCSRCYQL